MLHVEGLACIFPQRDLKSYFKGGGEIGEKEINEKIYIYLRKEKQKRRECVSTRDRPYCAHFYATFTESVLLSCPSGHQCPPVPYVGVSSSGHLLAVGQKRETHLLLLPHTHFFLVNPEKGSCGVRGKGWPVTV